MTIHDLNANGCEIGSKQMTRDWPIWLTIGATGFGGPAGQVAILHRELVEQRKWLDEEEFLAALKVCMLLPGPEAQQLATYAGWRRGGLAGGLLAGTLFFVAFPLVVTFIGFMAGWKAAPVAALQAGFEGAAVATLFAFLPSFAMILGLAPFVRSIHPASWLGQAMTAVGAAVVAAIVLLAIKLAAAALVPEGSIDPVAVVVALGSAAALLAGRASTPVVVAAAAAMGVLASLVH